MTIENKIRDEKLQYHINGEAAKIPALSSGKIDKHEYLAGEEIIPPDQRKMIEQVKFAYSLLRKVFEKQTKTIEEQRKKQVEALEVLDPEKNQPSIFQPFETIISFGDSIYTGKISIDEAEMDQTY